MVSGGRFHVALDAAVDGGDPVPGAADQCGEAHAGRRAHEQLPVRARAEQRPDVIGDRRAQLDGALVDARHAVREHLLEAGHCRYVLDLLLEALEILAGQRRQRVAGGGGASGGHRH